MNPWAPGASGQGGAYLPYLGRLFNVVQLAVRVNSNSKNGKRRTATERRSTSRRAQENMAAVEKKEQKKEQRFVTVDDLVAEIQKQLDRAGAPFSHELLTLLAEFRVKQMGLKEFCAKVRLLIGGAILMATVKGLQAAQIAEARRAHARRRWRRLRSCAPLLGRWSLYIQQLHAEVSFRPGGQGAKRCRDEFEALAAGGALDTSGALVSRAEGAEKHRRPTPAAQPAALRPPAGTPCDEERSVSPCFVGVVL